MSAETRERFIAALNRIEPELRRMGFQPQPIQEQGFATWATYARPDTAVEFVCAPPEYHIEMFLRVGILTYELADLMTKKRIEEWVRAHELKSSEGDALVAEAEWYVALLRVTLAEM